MMTAGIAGTQIVAAMAVSRFLAPKLQKKSRAANSYTYLLYGGHIAGHVYAGGEMAQGFGNRKILANFAERIGFRSVR